MCCSPVLRNRKRLFLPSKFEKSNGNESYRSSFEETAREKRSVKRVTKHFLTRQCSLSSFVKVIGKTGYRSSFENLTRLKTVLPIKFRETARENEFRQSSFEKLYDEDRFYRSSFEKLLEKTRCRCVQVIYYKAFALLSVDC